MGSMVYNIEIQCCIGVERVQKIREGFHACRLELIAYKIVLRQVAVITASVQIEHFNIIIFLNADNIFL